MNNEANTEMQGTLENQKKAFKNHSKDKFIFREEDFHL
jgi:hypothetical protein